MRDYLCLQTPVSMYVLSQCHIDIIIKDNCNSLRFTLHKLFISENRPCGSNSCPESVADPGFPVGGRGPRSGGRGLLRQLRFKNFECQNERIWTLRGACVRHAPYRSANVNTISKERHSICQALL